AAELAEYMVPTAIVVLESLPLTVNGKLDRRSLPAPDFTVTGTTEATRAPATATEAVLADLFGEVLGRGGIGVDDSFFGLGGDSIMSIQLVSRAKSAGLIFTPRDVFEAKTVAGLTKVLLIESSETAPVLTELPGGGAGPLPLTPIMEWLVERSRGDLSTIRSYSQSALIALPADVSGPALERAL
ncbi:phosphopantetheine-binding protein, partial [Rhodococcus erythropolis]|nr:phosphopantetheine-binding protein [Rhodococcus erythropolis]